MTPPDPFKVETVGSLQGEKKNKKKKKKVVKENQNQRIQQN